MTSRRTLPNRREHDVVAFEHRGQKYTAGYSRFPDGSLSELFLSAGRPNSEIEIDAHDAAILASVALQYGAPLQTIRRALLADGAGEPAGALAKALDLIDAHGYAGGDG